MTAVNITAIAVIYAAKNGIGAMHMLNMFARAARNTANAQFGKNMLGKHI